MRRRLIFAALRSLLALAGIVFLLFPHPGRALSEVRALRNPDGQLRPDDPAIERLSLEVDQAMPANLTRKQQVAWIEAWVEKRIPYANDWDTWLNVDYWPTPTETMVAGREDCDGIAIVTASLLRRRGFNARLEASIQHVWVRVDDGGVAHRILNEGKETNFGDEGWSLPSPGAVLDWFRYGLTSFPFWRWSLLVLWTVGVLRFPNRRRGVIESVFLLLALGAAAIGARILPDFLFGATFLVLAGLATWTLLRRQTVPAPAAAE